jgi:hypothetical protein
MCGFISRGRFSNLVSKGGARAHQAVTWETPLVVAGMEKRQVIEGSGLDTQWDWRKIFRD